MEQIIFAAGCFWGVQYYFDQVPGVTGTTAGYIGGGTDNPTYEEICTQSTGHAEAVQIQFDTSKVTVSTLCKQFFRMHDPTQLNRQGPDIGDQYRSAIFFVTDDQKEAAEKIMKEVAATSENPVVTVIERAGPFYRAEEYHQKFTERTGRGMCHVAYQKL